MQVSFIRTQIEICIKTTVVMCVFHMKIPQLSVNNLQDMQLKFFETPLPIFVRCNTRCLEALDF